MMTRRTAGLTLVEVLIVIALLALTSGVLLPALSAAREASRRAKCGATQRRLYEAAFLHANQNDDWIPGVNTTGLAYQEGIQAAQSLEGTTTPETPTSTYDWISPSIGKAAGLHPNRARRTKQIFEDLGCPSTTRMNDKTWGFSNDLNSEFLPLLEKEGIGQISYLAPAPFHLAGPGYSPTEYERFGWEGPAIPPSRYLPRLERVGKQLSRKIFVADGTRYLAADGLLDFDVHPNPEHYGSFTSSTPIFRGSTAYGSDDQANGWEPTHGTYGPGPGRSKLSYRHDDGINVVHFDGHLEYMTEIESKTNATPWHPSGSVFTGEEATDESLAFHAENERLH